MARLRVSLTLSFRSFRSRFDSKSDADNSGSIWSGGISIPFPTHQIQVVPLLYSRDLAWIVAVAFSSPYLFAVKLVENSGRMQCDRNAGWKEGFGKFSSFSDFTIVIYILFFYIPVLLLVILYSIILIKLKTQVHPGEHSSNVEQLRQRRNRSVIHMSIAIISVFVFCWLPFITNSSYFIEAVPLIFPVVSGYTVPSPNIWMPLTVLSTRLSASLLVAITGLVSKDS